MAVETYKTHLPTFASSLTPCASLNLPLCHSLSQLLWPFVTCIPLYYPSWTYSRWQAEKSQWGAKIGLNFAFWFRQSGSCKEIRQIWIFHINTFLPLPFPPFLPARHPASSSSSPCKAITAIISHHQPPSAGICNGNPWGHHNSPLSPHSSCHCNDVGSSHRQRTKWRHPAQARVNASRLVRDWWAEPGPWEAPSIGTAVGNKTWSIAVTDEALCLLDIWRGTRLNAGDRLLSERGGCDWMGLGTVFSLQWWTQTQLLNFNSFKRHC